MMSDSKFKHYTRRTIFSFPISLFAAGMLIALLVGAPAQAQTTTYSDSWLSSSGSGSIKGCGVTQHGYSSYNHSAAVSTTLTSPNGRSASMGGSGSSYVSITVSLALDSNDAGTYSTNSNHYGYCPYYSGGGSFTPATSATLELAFSINIMKKEFVGPNYYTISPCNVECKISTYFSETDRGDYIAYVIPWLPAKPAGERCREIVAFIKDDVSSTTPCEDYRLPNIP